MDRRTHVRLFVLAIAMLGAGCATNPPPPVKPSVARIQVKDEPNAWGNLFRYIVWNNEAFGPKAFISEATDQNVKKIVLTAGGDDQIACAWALAREIGATLDTTAQVKGGAVHYLAVEQVSLSDCTIPDDIKPSAVAGKEKPTTAAGGYQDELSGTKGKNSFQLFQGAAKSLDADLYGASIQYFAAEIRAFADTECYPPKGQGGNSPLVALGAFKYGIGEMINPKVSRDPALYARIVRRLENWDPSTDPAYKPGWEYKSACSDYSQTAKSAKHQRLKVMEDFSSLLKIPKYESAFNISQAFHMAPYEEQQKPQKIKQAHDAEDVILKIEKAKGLDVLTSEILQDRKNPNSSDGSGSDQRN